MKKTITNDLASFQNLKGRMSKNFSTIDFSGHTLYWYVEGDVTVRIMLDVPAGKGKVVFPFISDGTTTPMIKLEGLYIASLSSIEKDFQVVVSDHPL